MAHAKSARNCSRYDLDADCSAVGQLPDKFIALNIFFRLDALVLLAGVLLFLLMLAGAPLFVVESFDW